MSATGKFARKRTRRERRCEYTETFRGADCERLRRALRLGWRPTVRYPAYPPSQGGAFSHALPHTAHARSQSDARTSSSWARTRSPILGGRGAGRVARPHPLSRTTGEGAANPATTGVAIPGIAGLAGTAGTAVEGTTGEMTGGKGNGAGRLGGDEGTTTGAGSRATTRTSLGATIRMWSGKGGVSATGREQARPQAARRAAAMREARPSRASGRLRRLGRRRPAGALHFSFFLSPFFRKRTPARLQPASRLLRSTLCRYCIRILQNLDTALAGQLSRPPCFAATVAGPTSLRSSWRR